MGKCNMCGLCCMAIHLTVSPDYIQERKDWKGDMGFIANNWTSITFEQACSINPFFKVNEKSGVDYSKYYFYTCNKLKDRKCTVQGDKPQVCSGYPWYNHESHPEPFYSPTCGYREDVKLIENKGLKDSIPEGEPYIFKTEKLISKRNHKQFSWSYNKSVKLSDEREEGI